MPPYAGDFFMFGSSSASNAQAYNDVTPPTKPDAPAEQDDTSTAAESSSSSKFDALFDFNPCISMTNMTSSMNSAMFKERPCSWCGKGCNKIKGYKKEVIEGVEINEETGEEEPANQKLYFHKWCGQLNDWKQEHQESYSKVMDGPDAGSLLGRIRAIEVAERRRKEAEERARREAAERARREAERRAEEARLAREEAARKLAEEQERLRIEDEERVAREAKEERIQLEAEEARRKKQASLRYKFGKKLSAAKKAFTAPCKSKKAVDPDATGEAEEEEEPEM